MKNSDSYLSACKIIKKLGSAGHKSYLVGGCVRDFVMQRTPKDYDIVTSATPDIIKGIFPDHLLLGESFGVVAVRENDEFFEVATFREDGLYEDGRRPTEVVFTTSLEGDVKRRDFTINGMALDPISNEIIDLVGGRDSLKWRKVQTIGNPLLRFREDKLRMLRAIRFATVLDFKIEFNTFAAIKMLAKDIKEVSMERISVELQKIMESSNRIYGLLLLKECVLLRYILPEIDILDMVEQNPDWHPEGNVWVHTLRAIEFLPTEVKPHVAWATLFHDVGKTTTFDFRENTKEGKSTFSITAKEHDVASREITTDVLKRLKFPNSFVDDVAELVGQHMRFRMLPEMRIYKVKKLIAITYNTPEFCGERQFIKDLSKISFADSRSCILGQGKDIAEREIQKCIDVVDSIPLGEEIIKTVDRLVNGKDLIAMGLKPGRIFGEILSMVEEAQLESKITNQEEGLALVASFLAYQHEDNTAK